MLEVSKKNKNPTLRMLGKLLYRRSPYELTGWLKRLVVVAEVPDGEWRGQIKTSFDNYIRTQRDSTPFNNNWLCTKKGYEHNQCTMSNCWNGNGEPEIWNKSPFYNGYPCNEANGCWIGLSYILYYIYRTVSSVYHLCLSSLSMISA